MKTKEFIKRVEELGFEYEKAEEVYFIQDNEGTEYASVCHTTPNQISNMERVWDWIDKDTQEKLFNLLIEYAKTPIEEREEEKKYYLKHRWLRCLGGCALLHESTKFHTFVLMGGFGEVPKDYKMKFTQKEIEEIKENFDTDLSDFEMVEVEDEYNRERSI